jgi:hypothetical protein
MSNMENNNINEKMIQLITGTRIIQDMSKKLVGVTRKIKKIASEEGDILQLFEEKLDEDILDEGVDRVKTAIRTVVELLIDVIESCPLVGIEEVSVEEFNRTSADKSVQDMLDSIGLKMNEEGNNEHK